MFGLTVWMQSASALLLCAVCAGGLTAAPPEGPSGPAGYRWQSEPGSHLELVGKGGTLWRLNFKKEDGKPYFHPLSTTDGALLTWMKPSDHPWHWALWFSWKYINGKNYWEYDPKVGKPEGLTELVGVDLTRLDERGATAVIELSYHPPGQAAVLKEKRTLVITAPDAAGDYRIDWRAVFTAAEQDVVLDRTPPKEKPWGGYAGLSYRAAQGLTEGQMTDSRGRHQLAYKGHRANWVDVSGRFAAPEKVAAGLTIFDHPTNPRHPTPWHCVHEWKPGHPFIYINPALVRDRPLTIPAGESLELLYRVLVHRGKCEPKRLDREFKAFAAKRPD